MRAVVQRVSEASVTVLPSSDLVVGRPRDLRTGDRRHPQRLVRTDRRRGERLRRRCRLARGQDRLAADLRGRAGQDEQVARGRRRSAARHLAVHSVRRRPQGNAPGFIDAARPEVAQPLYARFCALVRERGIDVQEGVFRATMQVRIVNEGPVTLLLDFGEDLLAAGFGGVSRRLAGQQAHHVHADVLICASPGQRSAAHHPIARGLAKGRGDDAAGFAVAKARRQPEGRRPTPPARCTS